MHVRSLLIPVLFSTIFLQPDLLFASRSADSVLVSTEHKLRVLSDSILHGSTDVVRKGALAEFNPVFWDLLNTPESFQYGFDSLPGVSKIKSTDGKIRLFTWILPSRAGDSYSYYGVIQLAGQVNIRPQAIGLTESRMTTEEAESMELNSGNWYGAVYYDILVNKSGKHVIYTLLGWHGNDRMTTRKIIDTITLDPWGNVAFGAPVFVRDKSKPPSWRVIFEYNAEAVMLLRYDPGKKMIVCDHLSPSNPALVGQYQHYGPDFTYDGYRFRKGKWELKPNLELKNPPGRQ